MYTFRDDLKLRDSLAMAGPAGMVALVYEEIIRALEAAVEAIRAGDIASRSRAVDRAMDLVGHLYSCLDGERGGEIALNLAALYRFILSRLTMVNPRNDAEPAHQAILLVKPLLSSWQQLAHKEKLAGPASTPQPNVRTADVLTML